MAARVGLIAVAVIHAAIIVAAFASVPTCWILEPPWVSLLVTIFAVRSLYGTDGNICILNRWENHFRRELGEPEITGFVDHYVREPIKAWRARTNGSVE